MTTRRRTAASARRKQTRKTRTTAATPDSLRDVYLAGLGAVATAGEGAQLAFDALVARGRETEPRLTAAARRSLREARGAVEDLASKAGKRSLELVDEALEKIGRGTPRREKNILHRLGDLAEALL